MVANNYHTNVKLCKTEPQECQAFYLVLWAYTHILSTSMLMIIVSLYTIPKGKFLAPFLPFRTSYTNIYNVLLCVLNFDAIIPNLWFFEGFIRTPLKFIFFFEICKTVETRVEKVETHKTPLEQSSLILSIYFCSWPLEYSFQQTPHNHAVYIYRYIYEIIGDKGNFISR